MNLCLQANRQRPCPICAACCCELFAAANIRPEELTEYSYASRKEPEFMNLELLRCCECGVVYAPSIPDEQVLNDAYHASEYDSAETAAWAARTYARILRPAVERLQSKRQALDVGAGNGALLERLQTLGFDNVYGIEPSRAAIETAAAHVKPLITEGVFNAETTKLLNPDCITICQTIEHVGDPLQMLSIAHEILNTGGFCAVVAHDFTAKINKLLGKMSPIMDIEHLQLFHPASLALAMEKAGFHNVSVRRFANTYPLQYWIRLTPLPKHLKALLYTAGRATGFNDIPLWAPVGNMLAIGWKAS